MDGENLSIELWRADAIVLYDWLMSVDFTKIPITHRAQRQALMDLLTQLDVTDASQVSRDDIADAQERVARDMGWQEAESKPDFCSCRVTYPFGFR